MAAERGAGFWASLRGGRLVIAVVLAVGLVIALARALAAAYVEILWQAEAGYLSVFWKRMAWEWGIRAFAAAVVAVLVFFNLKVASATLGGIQIRRRFGNLEISEQIPRRYVAWAMLSASALLGLWFGAAVPPNLGIQALLLLSSAGWGVSEPVLGHDVGFYVFWVPLLGGAVTFALIVTFLIFTLATAGYAATGALRWVGGRVDAQDLARLHLGVLLTAFLVLVALRLWLGRYLVLLDGNSPVQGIFGFTDAQARLPALQTLTVICLGGAAGTAWGAWKNRPAPVIASVASVIIAAILIGQFYPALIQSFRVEPNELERESPYIEHNLEFTRLGFGLHDAERRRFEHSPSNPVDWAAAASQMDALPVWTRAALLTTYRAIEARFPYYDFTDVSIDRYDGSGGPVPVAISVREIDPGGLQDPNWQNLHLRERYVAGMGAVASMASAHTPEGRPEMLLSGIPPEARSRVHEVPGLELDRPEVFFGVRQQLYAIVNPGPDEYLAPDSSPGVAGIDFPEGIPLTSPLRTAILAWRFRDANLLLASDLTDESRFIFRRSVIERAQAVAPFLRFPESPYPVIRDGRIVWVLDAFTATSAFPLSSVYELGTFRSRVRYVRNSVKATVDAVTGELRFYRIPVHDPLADAYQAAFPGLVEDLDRMPEDLRAHLRYPRVLVDLQSRVLLQYHQETPAAFHGQQDVWEQPQELAESPNAVSYRPEYGIYALPGDPEERFNLTTAFVPSGRQNLTAVLVARTDDSGLPELILFDVSVADQVSGPRQVEALVEQDPLISQQFSLWRTGGSEVWTGHLHLIPVGNRLLYMEPVFLAASAEAIPELRRFVLSDGRRVVLAVTLGEAVGQLSGRRTADSVGDPSAVSTAGPWSSAALELLERAEARARAGDWRGFGQALEELRDLLESLEGEGR
jgi:hypothetical protein